MSAFVAKMGDCDKCRRHKQPIPERIYPIMVPELPAEAVAGRLACRRAAE
jgi:hypothetical protein